MPKLEPWIETYTGIKMFFLDPQPEMIDINDIAHSLSQQCRFSGHTKRTFSVAEHCIRVASLLYERTKDPKIALQGLLHDASEAYLLDVPSPVKQFLGGYMEMEEKLQEVILNKYHAGWPMNAQVKEADTVMLKNEAKHLLLSQGKSWANKYPTSYEYKAKPFLLKPQEAEDSYLTWFFHLLSEMNATTATIAA